MTRPETKTVELLHAEALLRLMPELGVIGEPEPRERPDFRLVLASGGSVGLEHVRAIDRRIAAGNGAIEKINERVLAGMVSAGTNASVVVSMDDGAAALLATKEMKPQLAVEIEAIVRLAKAALDDAPSRKSRIERRRAARGLEVPISPWRHYERFKPDIMLDDIVCWRDARRDDGSYDLEGRAIEFATAVMVRPDDEPNVGRSGSSWGQPPTIIQEAIDKKAAKLEDYRAAGYDAQWLLVVGSAATGGTLDISAADGEFASPYDRTFFFETFADECVELRTRPPG
jgi:hypothetical protein